jgi:hypothetical protein
MMQTNNHNISLRKLFLLVLLVVVSPASASSLFDDDAVLEVKLSGPLSSLLKEKDGSRELPFLLRANGIEHLVKVRLRGKSRRVVCSFPPLRINFATGDTAQSVFENQDKLKLVTQCQKRRSSQLDVLQEYAAYRIFNLLSEISYKVRLLHITYTDTEGRPEKNTFDHYGFLIESSSELADRVGGQPVQETGLSIDSLDSKHAATVFVFEYLIGNTDWSLVRAEVDDRCCHNGDLLDIGSARYYVPYDFDRSGLVNARYAKPDLDLRISRVTQRLYRGYCISTDALKNALGTVKARKADILGVISQLPVLSQKEIKATMKYLERFFDQASDEDKIVKLFERKCL